MNLFVRIRRFFALPVFDDEEKTRVAQLLHVILIVFALSTLLGMSVLVAPAWAHPTFETVFVTAAGVVMAAICVGLLALVRRGNIRLPAIVVSLVIWGFMTYWVIGVSGVRDSSILAYPLIVVIAGLLLGKRAAVVSTLVCAATIVVAYFIESSGLLPLAPQVLSIRHMIVPVTIVVMIGLLLRYAAGSLADALDNARRSERAQRQANQELNALREVLEQRVGERTASLERRSLQLEAAAQVARQAAGIRDVEQLLDETAHFISDRFGYYHTGIFLLDDLNEYAVLRAASSEGGQRMLARGHRLRVGETGIVGWSAGSGQPRIALDVGADAVFFDNPDLPETRSELALPLKVRDRVIGVLDVQSVEPAAFGEEDVAVLETMADQLALAIENAHLFQEAESRLREVSQLLARSSQEGWQRLTTSRPAWRYVYDRVDVRPAAPPEEAQVRIPLRVRETPIGQLSLQLGDRQPDPETMALVQAIAEQASQALESARLFQETQRALGEMEGLYRAIQAVSTEFDLERLTEKLVEEACRLLGADYGALVALDPASGAIRYFKTAGIAPGECTMTELPCGRGILQALLQGRTVRVDDLHTHPAFSGELPPNHLPIVSFLGVPLVYQNQVRGLLAVSNRATNPTFTAANERLLATFAAQATVAIENARLFDEARRRAEQERLLADISARVRGSVEIETILRTSIRELGRALRATDGLIRLGPAEGGKEETTIVQEETR